jgi:hypothetical protein
MEHRLWSGDDLAKLHRMAGKYPTVEIATELGRGVSALRVKAHELRISLRMKHPREGASSNADLKATG